MRNILLLTPQLPYPPHQGTSLRNLHILRALTLHNQVTLLSFAEVDRPQELEPLQAICSVLPPVAAPIRSGATRLRQLLTTNRPDLSLRLAEESFAAVLIDALRAGSFDAVQIEGIELAGFIADVRHAAPTVRVVLDCHNAETELQRRSLRADLRRPARWPAALYSAVQVGRLARFERWAMGAADAVIAVSEVDADYLSAQSGHTGAITVVPNSIDVDAYEWSQPIPSSQCFDLVFTGKMDYRPNVDAVLWFADEIWPLIVQRRPETTWAIVGQRPHPRLDRLRELTSVTLTGEVASIQPYLSGSKVYIAPLRIGSGTRLKLIEAMAARMAIVSTTVGAEGFAVEDGRHLLLADEPAAFAAAVLSLLNDPARRESLSTAAREFAEQYDWRRMTPLLDAVYDRLFEVE